MRSDTKHLMTIAYESTHKTPQAVLVTTFVILYYCCYFYFLLFDMKQRVMLLQLLVRQGSSAKDFSMSRSRFWQFMLCS